MLKKNSCLEKVAGKFQLKRSQNYFFKTNNSFLHYQKESTMTLLFVPLTVPIVLQLRKKEFTLTLHWSHKCCFAKTYNFLKNMYLSEILGRWYSRKCNMSDEMPQAGARICFCRMPSDASTVKCGNPQCPFVEFHLSCLAISTHFPRGGIAHTAAGSHSLSV